jgi:hypothetical protein
MFLAQCTGYIYMSYNGDCILDNPTIFTAEQQARRGAARRGGIVCAPSAAASALSHPLLPLIPLWPLPPSTLLQGLAYVVVPEPLCDWHTYDWIDGTTILGGPTCDGARGLTDATYGGTGRTGDLANQKCVLKFGAAIVDPLCVPSENVDVHHLLSYTCKPSH